MITRNILFIVGLLLALLAWIIRTVWVTSNLRLGYDKGYALSNELTNVDDTNTTVYYIPKAGFQGSNTTTNDMRASTTAANFSTSGDNRAKVQYAAVSNNWIH